MIYGLIVLSTNIIETYFEKRNDLERFLLECFYRSQKTRLKISQREREKKKLNLISFNFEHAFWHYHQTTNVC